MKVKDCLTMLNDLLVKSGKFAEVDLEYKSEVNYYRYGPVRHRTVTIRTRRDWEYNYGTITCSLATVIRWLTLPGEDIPKKLLASNNIMNENWYWIKIVLEQRLQA